jgi:hypothetical protein
MSRGLLTVFLLLLLMTSRVGAQAADSSFTLAVPLRGNTAASLARIESIAMDLGAQLQTARGGDRVMAAWSDGRQLSAQRVRRGTSGPILLEIICSTVQGGAEAMCRDVAQRYARAK